MRLGWCRKGSWKFRKADLLASIHIKRARKKLQGNIKMALRNISCVIESVTELDQKSCPIGRFLITGAGTWSLHKAGSLQTAASKLPRYILDLEAVQEVRCVKGGSQPAGEF
jgi:hypothetical protein